MRPSDHHVARSSGLLIALVGARARRRACSSTTPAASSGSTGSPRCSRSASSAMHGSAGRRLLGEGRPARGRRVARASELTVDDRRPGSPDPGRLGHARARRPRSSPGATRSPTPTSPRRCDADFDALTAEAEELVAELHRAARARATCRARRARPARVGRRRTSRRCGTLLDPLMQRFGDRMARKPVRADRPAGRRRPRSACCSATSRSACSASTTCSCPTTTRGDAVYYVGAQRPRAGEALRVPARATSGCGSRSTRSRTGRSSPACRGCATTSSSLVRAGVRARRPRSAHARAGARRARSTRCAHGRNPLDEGGLVGAVRDRPSSAACSARCRR